MKRVAVALSGGVDSTVAALLLKRSGYSLIGVFMRNWDERDETGECSADRDYRQVIDVCKQLDIPCTQVDFVKEYWNDVFSHFLHSYLAGHTPNPDILCNRHIKFAAFHSYCLHTLHVDTIATGHYARVRPSEHGVQLLRSVDPHKDQTYFLSQVPQEALRRTLFPIGHLHKRQVRRMAVEAGFKNVAERKESMGLCFVGKRHFPRFLHQYLEKRPGLFVTPNREVIGQHNGHHFYTVGQRARIGGQAHPWYVAHKDPLTNTVTVVEGTSHPALLTYSFTTDTPHWVCGDPLEQGIPLKCELRHRHQQPLVRCTVECLPHASEEGRRLLRVHSDQPLRAVACGQYAVFYRGEECLGGACITETGPSLWQQMSSSKSKKLFDGCMNENRKCY